MTHRKMHADELEFDDELVSALVAAQFPAWSELQVVRVPSFGTDNAMFRLGEDLVVRLPRVERAVEGALREYELLPRLAPHVPLAVPLPVAKGGPDARYPWPWFVYRWVAGDNPTLDDANGLADDLADFITALRRIDAHGAPAGWRGRPLETQHRSFATWIATQDDTVDIDAARRAWQRAVSAEPWAGPPTWFHGDLMSGNLLVRDGRLVAVIDFATAGVGDPAIDLLPAWALFDADARETFRSRVAIDDAMWERSRGWSVLLGLAAVPYYKDTYPLLAETGRRMLNAALAD